MKKWNTRKLSWQLREIEKVIKKWYNHHAAHISCGTVPCVTKGISPPFFPDGDFCGTLFRRLVILTKPVRLFNQTPETSNRMKSEDWLHGNLLGQVWCCYTLSINKCHTTSKHMSILCIVRDVFLFCHFGVLNYRNIMQCVCFSLFDNVSKPFHLMCCV